MYGNWPSIKVDVSVTLLAPSHSCSSSYAADVECSLQSTLVTIVSHDNLLHFRRESLNSNSRSFLNEGSGCTIFGFKDYVLYCLYLR